MERIIIDRFEGDYAVVERGEEVYDIPKKLLPSNAKEGDIVEISVQSPLKTDKYKDLFE